MLSNLLQKIQKLAAVGAISICAAGTASAGLFCNFECCRQPRPYYSPACEPAWGYHQTCWRKFPELEPCSGWGDYCPSCEMGGDVINANGYETQMMPMPGSPVLQGSPLLIQPPTHHHAQPTQSYAAPPQQQQQQQQQQYAQPTQRYEAPTQQYQQTPQYYPAPTQDYESPSQGYPQPMPVPNSPSPNSAPSTLTPIPQSEDSLPADGGLMPPIPDSVMYQQMPGNYCPVGQQQPQSYASNQGYAPQQSYAPTQGNGSYAPQRRTPPASYVPQGQPPANAAQGMPVKSISFSRARPANNAPVTVQPHRTLLQRILPGGK